MESLCDLIRTYFYVFVFVLFHFLATINEHRDILEAKFKIQNQKQSTGCFRKVELLQGIPQKVNAKIEIEIKIKFRD